MNQYTTSTEEGVPGETITQIKISYLESLEALLDRVQAIIKHNSYSLPPAGVDEGDPDNIWGGIMFASAQAAIEQKRIGGRMVEETSISRLSTPDTLKMSHEIAKKMSKSRSKESD